MMWSNYLLVCFLLFVSTSATDVCANGYEFDLKHVGRINAKRDVPKFDIVRRPERLRTEKHVRFDSIFLRFRDGRMLRLGERAIPLTTASKLKREAGVIEGTVTVGWLAEARDLLLVAWTDNSAEFGTGHYLYRGTMVVRHTESESVSLLRFRSLVSAANNHIVYPGLTYHYFDFDGRRNLLIDRISQFASLSTEHRTLLHFPIKSSDGEKLFKAEIRQLVICHYKYRAGALESRSIRFYYQSQGRETLQDIAKYYLGPLASSNAILRANEQLWNRGLDSSGAGIIPPKETRVLIPVPKEWLLEAYASVPDS